MFFDEARSVLSFLDEFLSNFLSGAFSRFHSRVFMNFHFHTSIRTVIMRTIKWIAGFFLLITVVLALAIGVAIYYLHANGVRWERVSLLSTSAARVEGLEVKNASFFMYADCLSLDWSWQALFEHAFEGSQVLVSDAIIRRSVSTTALSETIAVPAIHISDVVLINVLFENMSSTDTTSVWIPDLQVHDLQYNGVWKIQDFSNRGCQWTTRMGRSVIAAAPDSTFHSPASSALQIPDFSIQNLTLSDCSIVLDHPEFPTTITSLNLGVRGLKQRDLMDIRLELLSFCYQDSVLIDLDAEDGQVDGNREGTIRNLHVVIPGAALHAPELWYSTIESCVAVNFSQSYLNPALLAWIWPSKKDVFDLYNVPLHFDGIISYGQRQLQFQTINLALGQQATLLLNGVAGIGGDEYLNLQIRPLHSSSYNLGSLFNYKMPVVLRDFPVRFDLKVNGRYDHLHADLTGSVGKTVCHATAEIDLTSDEQSRVRVDLRTPGLALSEFYASDISDIRIRNMHLYTSIGWDRAYRLSPSEFRLSGDSISVAGNWLRAPVVQMQTNSASTKIQLSIRDNATLALESPDNVWEDDRIRYAGYFRYRLPADQYTNLSRGELFATGDGFVEYKKSMLTMALQSDSLVFRDGSSQDLYKTRGQIKLSYTETGEMSVNLSWGADQYLKFRGDENILSWWNRPDKWESDFPAMEASAHVQLDSTLVNKVFSRKGGIDVHEFKWTATADAIRMQANIPYLQIENLRLDTLTGDAGLMNNVFTGSFAIGKFTNPVTVLTDVRLGISTPRDSMVAVALNTFLPEINSRVSLGGQVDFLRHGYKFNFGDQDFVLGEQHWQTNEDSGTGLIVNNDFSTYDGSVHLRHEGQRISLEGGGQALRLVFDSVEVYDLVRLMIAEPALHGKIHGDLRYYVPHDSVSWDLGWHRVSLDTVNFGMVSTHGNYAASGMDIRAIARHEIGNIDASLYKRTGPLRYTLSMKDVDLQTLARLLPTGPRPLALTGVASARITGTYDTQIHGSGYVAAQNTELYMVNKAVHLKLPADTLWVDDTHLSFRGFEVLDRNNNPFRLNGNVLISSDPLVDISLTTDRFRIFEQNLETESLTGKVDISTNLNLKGPFSDLSIHGKASVLPDGSLTYLYSSSIGLDDREKEIQFYSFKTDSTAQPFIKSPKPGRTSFLNWNVDFSVGSSNLTVLFNEASQDYVKAVVTGDLRIRTGGSDEMLVYGNLQSHEGSIIYDAPMISDLNFEIEQASVAWQGEPDKPTLSFLGTEPFRISPADISASWDKTGGLVPINVLARINNRPLSNFDLEFDLSSSDTQVGNWILSLPEDTRQAYAISLMLFGRINTDSEGQSASLMQSLVGKMNEISRRNIRNADLSFYVDRQNRPQSGTTTTNGDESLGFSFSKGLFNKKVRLSIGGNLDLDHNSNAGTVANVKVDYYLNKEHDLSVNASKGSAYTGVIDGQVDETSLGFSFVKKFRNFFHVYKKRKAK
jgi:hypothetical protein